MLWIALFYLSPIFALDCSLTESLESLDPVEYVKGYKALGYPFWVKSENRISVLSKIEKKFKTALAPADFDIAFTKINKIFDSTGKKLNECSARFLAQKELICNTDNMNNDSDANFARGKACLVAGYLALWVEDRFNSNSFLLACKYSGLADPCITLNTFLSQQESETNTILNNYLSQLSEVGKPQSVNLMIPSLLWSNRGDILFSQRNIECTESLAKSCDLGNSESCEKMYFIIVGGLGNVSIGPEYISKKNHFLNFGCNSGSALCCYYYSLITRGKLPKKSKSLLLKSLEMKYPPERVYRDVADYYGWGKFGFSINPKSVVTTVQEACDKLNIMCSELAWIYYKGYGGVEKGNENAIIFGRKACQFGDFVGCVVYYYLSSQKELPLSLPSPQFADIKSQQHHKQLLKKLEKDEINIEDTAKDHAIRYFSLFDYRYTTQKSS